MFIIHERSRIIEQVFKNEHIMIEIHWDYTDGTEVSWVEGLKLGDNFTTCCTKFFNQDIITEDVVVLRKDGKKVAVS